MDLSIIIVNWNTCEITCACLESIFSQETVLRYEVIVVDNGSRDDSVKQINERFPRVKMIANDQNMGFAAANNQAIDIANGSYVLLLNSDTIVLEKCLDKAVQLLEANPSIGCIGAKAFNKDMTIQVNCFRFPSLLDEVLTLFCMNKFFPNSNFFNRMRYGNLSEDLPREVEVVAGCFMLVRRIAIEKVGQMDATFFMYAEEMDWCRRFRMAGWKVLYAPEVRIIHFGGQSSQHMKSKMILQLRAGILQFVNKHYLPIIYYLHCISTSIWFGIRVPGWLLKGLLIPQGRKSSLAMSRVYAVGCLRSITGWKALAFKK